MGPQRVAQPFGCSIDPLDAIDAIARIAFQNDSVLGIEEVFVLLFQNVAETPGARPARIDCERTGNHVPCTGKELGEACRNEIGRGKHIDVDQGAERVVD